MNPLSINERLAHLENNITKLYGHLVDVMKHVEFVASSHLKLQDNVLVIQNDVLERLNGDIKDLKLQKEALDALDA